MKTNEPVDKKPWRSEELNDIIGDNIYHDKLEATKDNSLDKELDDILDEFQAQVEDGYAGPVNGWTTLKQEAKAAIKSKLDSQKAELIKEIRENEPEERKEVNKILHNRIFAILMGNMTIPQARVQATTMMYTINSHLSKYWSPKQPYCKAQQLHGRQIFLCDRDVRHEGEHSWELVDKINELESKLAKIENKEKI